MDYLPDQETLSFWMVHYGSFVFFCLLTLGVVALPIPDETLMVLAGIFMRKGDLPIGRTLLAAFLGSMCGITISYLLGKTIGARILHQYGRYIGITENKLKRVHNWFEHYGKWTLTFGFFVPGVRHLTGFAAGLSELEYRPFALFAYAGAFIWATFFLSMGYYFGDCCDLFYMAMESVSEMGVVLIAALLILSYFLWKKFRR